MKKTFIKIIIDEIRSSFGRFSAIFSIVALSIGFLSGLLVTTPDMIFTADNYYDESNAADIFIKATKGLTQNDIEKLSSIDGVEEIMPAYVIDYLINSNKSEILNGKIFGIPLLSKDKLINDLNVISGRMPENKNECLVEKGWGSLTEIDIGSKINISKENEKYEDIYDTFNVLEFTVVGIVENPFYFSIESERSNIGNGTSDALIYVDESSYSLDVYTDFFIILKDAKFLTAFTDDYEDYVESYVNNLKSVGKQQSIVRLSDIKEEAYEKLNEAKTEYSDAKNRADKELSDAFIELEDGRKELLDAENDIKKGRKELADAKITLIEETEKARKEIDDAYVKLADAKIELEDGEIKYNDGLIEFQDGQKEYDDGLKDFLEAEQELIDAQAEFDKGEKEYLDGVKKLQDGKEELASGSRQLASAREELTKGEEEYNKGYAQLQVRKGQFNGLVEGIIYTINTTSGSSIKLNSANELFYAIENDESGMVRNAVNNILFGMLLEGYEVPGNSNGLLEAKDDLENGEQELAAAADQISDGWAQYNSGRAQLSSGRRKIQEAEKELEEAKIEIEDNRKKLEDGWIELEDGRKELNDAFIKLTDATKELEDARKELDDGWIEYYDGLEELNEAEITLKEETEKAEKEIHDAEIDLAKGIKDYEKGLIEFYDGEEEYLEAKIEVETELSDAARKILDAEKEISDLDTPQWYVLDRNSNVSYASFSANATKVEDIAKVFPVFFFLIAALVTLTTMTRMVEEERTQIGTLKALGYKKSTIISKYIIYSGMASTLGCAAGIIIGFRLFPKIIWNAYRTMYKLPPLTSQWLWRYALPESILIIVMTIGVTVYVTMSSLKERPSTLMLPRAPKPGKRIFLENIEFIWSRMKFTHKSTARNIMRYKRHLYMTVIGIAGCSALILTGFGLLDSIGSIANTQFEEIFNYDLNVQLENVDEYDTILKGVLEDKNKSGSYSEMFSEVAYIYNNNDRISVSVRVPKDSVTLNHVFNLRDRASGNKINFDNSSVIMSEMLAKTIGIKAGESFILENGEGKNGTFILTGIAENYVGTYLYINSSDYLNVYNKEIDYNSIFIKSSYNNEDLVSNLLSSESVMNVEKVTDIKSSFDNLLSTIKYIVVVIIIASGALAVIVLYNLTNININERRKELSTLKVLGYHNEEVAAYVFRETFILSVIGTLLGLPLGKLLHSFVVITVEAVNLMMGRNISLQSYIYSVSITLIFSLLVNLIMNFKLRSIEMVESMKAID